MGGVVEYTIPRELYVPLRELKECFHRRMVVFSGLNSGLYAGLLVKEYCRIVKPEVSILYAADNLESSSIYREFKNVVEGLGNVKFEGVLYKDSEKVLGLTYDILVLDLTEQLKPNDVGRLVEVVGGGGLVIAITPKIGEWEKTVTRFQKKLIVSPYNEKDVKHRFTKRFIKNLLNHEGIWIVEDGKVLHGKPLPVKFKPKRKILIPSNIKFPLRLYELAKTQDQVEALSKLERLLTENYRKTVILITANRGRGKSAVLGLGAAGLLYMLGQRRKIKIRITAPSYSNIKTVLEFAEKALNVLGVKVEKIRSRGLILTLKSKLGVIDCVSPTRIIKRKADIVFVDEAAGIPIPLLFKILTSFKKIVYSSTIHGYEGSGRGFRLRFLKTIKAEKKFNLEEVEMEASIRYDDGDPMEKWLYDTLLLDAEPVSLSQEEIEQSKPEEAFYEEPNLDEWFTNYEDELKEFFGIYVLAHYRNRPDDLAILGDAPHHHARVLRLPNRKIVASLHLADEGLVPDSEIKAIIEGANPPGNVIPSCIVRYYPIYSEFAKLKGVRVVRIAVHPDIEDRGFGSYALKKLCLEAKEKGYDWIGSSFGLTYQLLNFWVKNGFIPVHLSPGRNIVSGEYSVFVIKPLTEKAWKIVEALSREFKIRLVEALSDTYFDLEPETAWLLLKETCNPYLSEVKLTSPQFSRISAYARGLMTYEASSDAIKILVKSHFLCSGLLRLKLKREVELALIAKTLQGKSWDKASKLSGVKPTTIKSTIREAVGEMFKYYGEREAIKLL